MGLFRKGPPPHQMALAMIGARPGNRVLVAGTPVPAVVAELARTTGLLGQTLLAGPDTSRAPYEHAAAEAGVLVEHVDAPANTSTLPQTEGHHDLVALHFDLHALDSETRTRLVQDAFSAARPGGRVVIIEGRAPSGWFGGRSPALAPDAVLALLTGAGGLAPRLLGSEDGVTYFEARKAR